MSEEEEVKKIEIKTPEQALDMIFESFMSNVHWFVAGLGGKVEVNKTALFILDTFEKRFQNIQLDPIEIKEEQQTNVPDVAL